MTINRAEFIQSSEQPQLELIAQASSKASTEVYSRSSNPLETRIRGGIDLRPAKTNKPEPEFLEIKPIEPIKQETKPVSPLKNSEEPKFKLNFDWRAPLKPLSKGFPSIHRNRPRPILKIK